MTNLIPFHDLVTHLVDEGKAVDVVYLDFSKAFDTVTYSILLQNLAVRGLDRHALVWVRNWLKGQAQRAVVNGVKSSWRAVTSEWCFPGVGAGACPLQYLYRGPG